MNKAVSLQLHSFELSAARSTRSPFPCNITRTALFYRPGLLRNVMINVMPNENTAIRDGNTTRHNKRGWSREMHERQVFWIPLNHSSVSSAAAGAHLYKGTVAHASAWFLRRSLSRSPHRSQTVESKQVKCPVDESPAFPRSPETARQPDKLE